MRECADDGKSFLRSPTSAEEKCGSPGRGRRDRQEGCFDITSSIVCSTGDIHRMMLITITYAHDLCEMIPGAIGVCNNIEWSLR